MKALFDTNILIDYLSGRVAARKTLASSRDAAISVITWTEVMVGAKDDGEAARLKNFLLQWPVLDVNLRVAEQAAEFRRKTGVRVPDALIWATAKCHDRVLLTRNTRDFKTGEFVRVPYRL